MADYHTVSGEYPVEMQPGLTAWKRMRVCRCRSRHDAEKMQERLEARPSTGGRNFRVEDPGKGPADTG